MTLNRTVSDPESSFVNLLLDNLSDAPDLEPLVVMGLPNAVMCRDTFYGGGGDRPIDQLINKEVTKFSSYLTSTCLFLRSVLRRIFCSLTFISSTFCCILCVANLPLLSNISLQFYSQCPPAHLHIIFSSAPPSFFK